MPRASVLVVAHRLRGALRLLSRWHVRSVLTELVLPSGDIKIEVHRLVDSAKGEWKAVHLGSAVHQKTVVYRISC